MYILKIMLEASRCIDREDNIIVSYSTLIESNEIQCEISAYF